MAKRHLIWRKKKDIPKSLNCWRFVCLFLSKKRSTKPIRFLFQVLLRSTNKKHKSEMETRTTRTEKAWRKKRQKNNKMKNMIDNNKKNKKKNNRWTCFCFEILCFFFVTFFFLHCHVTNKQKKQRQLQQLVDSTTSGNRSSSQSLRTIQVCVFCVSCVYFDSTTKKIFSSTTILIIENETHQHQFNQQGQKYVCMKSKHSNSHTKKKQPK